MRAGSSRFRCTSENICRYDQLIPGSAPWRHVIPDIRKGPTCDKGLFMGRPAEPISLPFLALKAPCLPDRTESIGLFPCDRTFYVELYESAPKTTAAAPASQEAQ